MNHTLSLSDALYEWLQAERQRRGLSSIEALLEIWQAENDLRREREAAVREITNLQARLHEVYGEMPDSVELVRDDRTR